MSSKHLIKVRSFPGVTCFGMYHYLIPLLEKKKQKQSMWYCMLEPMVLPSWRNKNCWQTVGVEIIYGRTITSNTLKIADIQSHLRKLQIDMIENGNIKNNHLNSRGLHLNSKDVIQFAKNLIKSFRKLWYEKELLRQKKVSLESCDHNSWISPNNFSLKIFSQPNVNGMDYCNAIFKKQRESVINQISNKAKTTNHNLDIEGLINSKQLYTNSNHRVS